MEINDVLSISLCVIYDREREMRDIFSIENRKQGLNYKPGEQLYQEELFPVQKYSKVVVFREFQKSKGESSLSNKIAI